MEAWQTTLLSSIFMAVLSFLLARRMYSATVNEKEANAAKILSSLAADLAAQVKAYADMVPGWKQTIADADAAAKKAKEQIEKADLIKGWSEEIVMNIDHLSHFGDPNEPPNSVTIRFLNIKELARKIIAVEW